MEWSREKIARLIKLYREKRVLWDPTVTDFKDRNKKHDAWFELGTDMGSNSQEVEKKVRMLIGQFNRELKKGKSRERADATYKSKWAYFKMLLFLYDKNEPRYSRESDFLRVEASYNQDTVQSQDSNNKNDEQYLEDNAERSQQKTVTKIPPHKSLSRISTKRKADVMAEEAYAGMKSFSCNIKGRDEFDVFGEHIAYTLRKLSRSTQIQTKFEISNVLYQAEINDQQPSYGTSCPSSLSGSSTPISFHGTPIPSNKSSTTENNDNVSLT